MANKPADRTAEAPVTDIVEIYAVLLAEIDRQERLKIDRIKKKLNAEYGKPREDKAHVYVNGRHKLSTDIHKAHAIAQSYMAQGDSVWVSRQAITLR